MRPVTCLLLVWSIAAIAQKAPAKASFEVAIIRPIDPNNSVFVGMSADPSMVRYDNLTLRDAIRGAYMVRDFQIVAPDWLSTARFSVQAKLPAGAGTEQIPEMFQSLLEERFGLTYRRDPKEMQVYALVVGKEGPKLKPAQESASKGPLAMGTDGKPRPVVFFGGSAAAVTVTAPAASLLTLVGVTSRFTGRPLVDDTGIDGLYDFKLTFAPEVTSSLPTVAPPPNPSGAVSDPVGSLSDAVKSYGLRVESRKSSVDMFVITHIEKTPTEN